LAKIWLVHICKLIFTPLLLGTGLPYNEVLAIDERF